jgi:hypothetical protein
MKYLVLALLFIQSSFAYEISSAWNEDFTKSVEIICAGNEQCESTFGEGLVFNEEICEECFSTSLNMTFIFNGLGESITAKNEEANMDEFFSFLFMNDFISIKFDTPYDLITSESPIRKKIKFKKLCGFASVDPILFFERSANNEMGYPRYIYCGDSVRELEMFSTDLDSDYLDVLEGSQVF